ncbi:DUF4407 domain-containing protein [Streptomyces sp. NBC_01257]|uniref:DUF4407 domain-containing protein n=1 Tax=Streptomyces sp. NBC_01257 TaxID=2903799 RepID=UPI002DD91E91|nr:DUF4407 domain-containing protein [Streptomyces sp. NBC_01257]WRZ67067.1 DUF4407 domain-containing protein [Streptomyces sp. NBC_01257]
MAADTPVRPPEENYDTWASGTGPAHGPRRGRRSGRGPAVFLRRLIGVREEILDRESAERARYTWYGAIVLNTALLGGASMALAISTIREGTPVVAAVLIGVIWAWIVLALDSWLVSSTHGYTGGRAVRMLVPRLFLSVVLGLTIAEPMLFQIFDREIRQEMAVSRERDLADFRGSLTACNPLDGADTTSRADCGDFHLTVKGAPASIKGDIGDNTDAVARLDQQIKTFNDALDKKLATERRECAKERWIRRGNGWDTTETCERARADTSAYRRTSKVAEYEKKRAELVGKGNVLSEQLVSAGTAYRTDVKKAIDAKVADRESSQQHDGLLLRAEALSTVAWSDGFALFMMFLLHAVLLLVDAMPVLAKLMSGPSEYDRRLGERREANQRIHLEDQDVQRQVATIDHEVRRYAAEVRAEEDKSRLGYARYKARAEHVRMVREELDARTARLLGE